MPRGITLEYEGIEAIETMALYGLDAERVEQVKSAHPPKRAEALWGPTFPAALISACLTSPVLTPVEVEGLHESWSAADFEALFDSAWAASDTELVDFSERFDADSRLMEELDYCLPLGVEHCAFLRWCSECRAKALLWDRRKRAQCPGCGLRKDEWESDPDGWQPTHEVCKPCSDMERYRELGVPKGIRGARYYVVTTEEFIRREEAAGKRG